eukprot:TRINITY_DN5338_c0_g1_i1.p1 TRINITY_DN5338_c0_g1~~TRINITY_DN5338_c0_g1_i1.p1  ORF type:complete len:144 (-),score=20.89 TRINITY_DN5338_c0_g1_i1:206-637(-)
MNPKQVNTLRRLLRVLNSRITYSNGHEVLLKISPLEVSALFLLAHETHQKQWRDKGSRGCDNLYTFLEEVKLKQTFQAHRKCIARNLYLSAPGGDVSLFKRLVTSAIDAYEYADLAKMISQLQEQYNESNETSLPPPPSHDSI